MYIRYAIWLVHVLQGNLGESYFSRQTVLQLVAGALPITAELATLALAVAVIIAIPAALVLANLIATAPGQAAARTQPATILRTE